MCAIALGVFVWCASAATKDKEKTLHDFRGGNDGEFPDGSLIADGAGNLYGTTGSGGDGTGCDNGSNGCGTVFRRTASGQETVLYAFAGGSDGAFPNPGLVADNAGNLYGDTGWGGGASCPGASGCGTVFKLTPDGTESVLYAFQGGSDGWDPWEAGVAMDANGNLYGETLYGGNFSGSVCAENGCGTVYEVAPDGTKLMQYDFQAGSDGVVPSGGVILDGAGNIYGTTALGGGTGCSGDGCGTVFKIPANGTETVLYAFQGGADGSLPFGVTIDGAGNLYGVTEAGGNCTFQPYENNCGTVYKLTPGGTKTVLYNFQGGNDGLLPEAPLTIDANGNLFGTTFLGGGDSCKKPFVPAKTGYGCGTVFEVAPDGKETVLYAVQPRNGAHPYVGSLLLGPHGALYGGAPAGGRYKYGTVFEVKTKQKLRTAGQS